MWALATFLPSLVVNMALTYRTVTSDTTAEYQQKNPCFCTIVGGNSSSRAHKVKKRIISQIPWPPCPFYWLLSNVYYLISSVFCLLSNVYLLLSTIYYIQLYFPTSCSVLCRLVCFCLSIKCVKSGALTMALHVGKGYSKKSKAATKDSETHSSKTTTKIVEIYIVEL